MRRRNWTYSVVELPEALHDASERIVVRAELDLAPKRSVRTTVQQKPAAASTHLSSDVKDEVASFKRLEPLLEPVEVCLKVLHAVEHCSVRAEVELLHRSLHRHERRNGQGAGVREQVVGRVEIDDVDGSSERREELPRTAEEGRAISSPPSL